MESILNLQMSLFGSFTNIKPKNDLIIQLLTNLKDYNFIPGTVEVAVLDAQTKQITSDSRLQLFSEDKTINIVFLQDRIDFNYNLLPDALPIKDIRSLVDSIGKYVQKVFSVFPSTTGNRLAINCRCLLDNMNEIELKSFIEKYNKIPSFLSIDNLSEWNMRLNNPEYLLVNVDNKEICNRIIEIGIMNSVLDDSKAIGLTFDVNTVADNTEMRFTYKDLLFFANENIAFVCSALSEIER
jgi:hypothetical protein